MAKKSVLIDKKYLEEKLKNLQDQIQKVAQVLDQYSKLYGKLEGAIEITAAMLKEFDEPIKEEDDDNKVKPGS